MLMTCFLEFILGQARKFRNAIQRVSIRGPAKGVGGAVSLLGACDDKQSALGLEMPAGIHRAL